jgi:two-component system KDP operon response regulator KdpE
LRSFRIRTAVLLRTSLATGHSQYVLSIPPTPRASVGVLVVDDDAGVRDVCTVMLRSLGYRAAAESSGEEALAALDAAAVELVLLDLEMPNMKGAEVLRTIKQRRPNLRVVVMSGRPREDLRNYLSTGADAVIHKPFRLAELGRSIGKALAS